MFGHFSKLCIRGLKTLAAISSTNFGQIFPVGNALRQSPGGRLLMESFLYYKKDFCWNQAHDSTKNSLALMKLSFTSSN